MIIVYDICRAVVKTGRPLIDLLEEDAEIRKHINRKGLEKLSIRRIIWASPATWSTACWRCGK